MWAQEVASVADLCVGRGLDPGAGRRTVSRTTTRCDVFARHRPHVCSNALRLPFRDGSFDYVFTSHLLEHLPDPHAAIREWLRVVRVGGLVASVVPNTLYTRGMNQDATPHLHEWTPREFVTEVFELQPTAAGEVLPWWHDGYDLNWAAARVVRVCVACPNWSFAFVVQREA